ncbi:MAG TPA: hypothetical protein VHX87_06800 [Galbitalea sp.]|nr:hypothetical protein [Galbitalea sp.]
MSVWVVALIALLFFTGPLAAAGHAWWVFTPAVALGLGILGLIYVQVRRP